MKVIDKNKKAYFDYFLDEKFEAGIVLQGSEVKSVKLGNINLKDSFCQIENGEAWLKNCQISPYEKGSYFNDDPRRNRKLLLSRREIDKIAGKVKNKGFTLIPTMVYFKDRYVKVEIALAKGKQTHDKRDSIKEKDLMRDAQREIKNYK